MLYGSVLGGGQENRAENKHSRDSILSSDYKPVNFY